MERRARRQVSARSRKRIRVVATEIKSPLNGFVSASQKEFTSLRTKLKSQLELVKIGRKRPFKGTLVERKLGERIRTDIRLGLDEALIYVILLGNESSPTTIAEFDDAWIRGIPVLIYDYKRRGKKDGMSGFRAKLRKRGIRAQVPEVPYRSEQDVISHVIDDLAEKLGEVGKKYADVRNIIARKGLYSEPGR